MPNIYKSFAFLNHKLLQCDHHLLISKASNDDRTTTQVKELLEDDRIDEVARMISGASVTELTRENAKEMIAQNHQS